MATLTERIRTALRRPAADGPRPLRGRAAASLAAQVRTATGLREPALWGGAAALASLLLALIAWRRWGPGAWRSRRISHVMVEDVLTIEPSATLMEAAQRMREGNVGMLPVVESGRLRGVVTDRDLVIRAMARGVDPTATSVSECMTTEALCANPNWDVEAAIQVMADCQIGRLPVVDDANRIVGVVSLSSLALRSREEKQALEAAEEVSRRSTRVA